MEHGVEELFERAVFHRGQSGFEVPLIRLVTHLHI